MQAGFIGLGAMGYAMAANLHRAGLLHAVCNRGAEPRERFAAAHDIQAMADIGELAAVCDVIVTCVSADADVLAVVDTILPAMQPGTTIIDCSTVASDTAREAASRVADRGGAFLDAPVSGGTEGAANGTLAMMVGGDEAAFEHVRPALEAMGQRIVYMGDAGSGQATKAVNQVMAAGINQAVTEALSFATALNLPLDKVIEVVGSGAAGNWFVQNRGPTMIRDEYSGFGFKVALHHKDLAICRHMAETRGGQLPLAERTLADYERLMADDHGNEDISALFRLKRKLF
ncbi:NAD(P)-dependent oxidoreductase [Spectribacter hydrogenoxidans]|uniref:NAD(P)-dependent oxidoreductase n=1 Tax=Spectribacter hydrogenoxidans TaxID=3075608 RepID=A0ABU3BZ85_9GAMM|nr:NAD(P)-dependent oxidoreductase [Salinisphaera sp. W335]MDT0634622.1 NAD(P)-dependent oxidoreductase [Salinisphaera sp. W335]